MHKWQISRWSRISGHRFSSHKIITNEQVKRHGFAHLRQGWSLAEETETAATNEFLLRRCRIWLWTRVLRRWTLFFEYEPTEEYTLPEKLFYYPYFYDYEISYNYLIYNHQHSAYGQDLEYNFGTQASFAYEIVLW